MLKMMLCCDVTTMNCTADDIDSELSTFAPSYQRVSDSIWFFTYPSGFVGSYCPATESIFYDHFEKFCKDDSVIFVIDLREKFYCNLPESAMYFLEQDQA